MKKAQAAMEYLMTYGWAILIVIIVAAALVALGVFDPCTWSPPAATGFSVFTVPSGGWNYNSTGFEIVLKNTMGGGSVEVTDIDATYGSTSSSSITPANATLGVGDQQTFLVNSGFGNSAPATGSCYSLDVVVTYKTAQGLSSTESGTITGRAS